MKRVLFLSLFFVSCYRPTNNGPAYGEVVGDSVAYGYGAKQTSSNLTTCLSNITGKNFSNRAISGSTSRDWLTRLKSVELLAPKLVFISLGGNDLLHNLNGKWVKRDLWADDFPATETLENMRKLIQGMRDLNIDVIYLGIVPPVTLLKPKTLFIDDRLAKVQNEVAPAAGALVVRNAFDDMWMNSNFMYDDIHPNDRGYAKVCARIHAAMAADPHFAAYLRTN